ncbi:MAG: ATPase family associated with various cellular activities (AAA) [Elusimicrobia bacterium ADurb.Bin231]|nr:MAG: ATPase family associated with various cellular activities (AAA) [Elusimicrobia bacterium ADurb.Bin231]
MNDGRVTIDGNTLPLPELFMVIATQNPVEYHGTYPLPEAQLDRFFLRLKIGYPLPEHEKKIIHEKDLYDRAHKIDSVLSTKEVEELQKTVPEIRIDESLVDYILKIVNATRNSKSVKLGVSPRGTLLLVRAAQAYAVTFGRDYVVPDDIKAVVVPVLSHRIVIDSNLYGFSRINESDGIINELVKKVPVPV